MNWIKKNGKKIASVLLIAFILGIAYFADESPSVENKKADNKMVLNADLWQELYALTKVHEVTFHKVEGHADDELNNRCDALARGEIEKLRNKKK